MLKFVQGVQGAVQGAVQGRNPRGSRAVQGVQGSPYIHVRARVSNNCFLSILKTLSCICTLHTLHTLHSLTYITLSRFFVPAHLPAHPAQFLLFLFLKINKVIKTMTNNKIDLSNLVLPTALALGLPVCSDCQYWQIDPVSKAGGLGACLHGVKRSLLPWPNQDACNAFKAIV